MKRSFITDSKKTCGKSKQLSDTMIMILIALIASFPPLSTDMYLPALPMMSEQLKCSAQLVTLSIVLFFVFLSISAIFWGPLSDKYGRKPILLIGVPMFVLFSFFCVLSQNVYQLIAFRIFQAVGAGAAMAVSFAIVKDVFPGKKRERTFAIVAVLNGVIPVAAPSIGALIIRLVSWRGVFALLVIIGVIVLVYALFMEETNKELADLSVFRTTLRLLVVMKNPDFTRLTLVFSAISIPLLAYISVSSFIFINHFGLSKSAYGIYFGIIAAMYIFGGPIYLFLQRYFKPIPIITVTYLGSLLSGILILTIGRLNPVLFAISVACGYFCIGINKPPSSSLLLEQQEKDTGSASSLIQAVFLLTGSAGMVLISYDWSNRIIVLGIMNIILSAGGFFLWLYTKKRCRMPEHFN